MFVNETIVFEYLIYNNLFNQFALKFIVYKFITMVLGTVCNVVIRNEVKSPLQYVHTTFAK